MDKAASFVECRCSVNAHFWCALMAVSVTVRVVANEGQTDQECERERSGSLSIAITLTRASFFTSPHTYSFSKDWV